MIKDHFLNNLFKAANVIDNNENGVYKQCPNQIPFQSYRLLVANAVPFQCSLGEKLSIKENCQRKEEILDYCLNTFENEIIGRIKVYNPDIVINCCTEQSKQKVQSIIDKTFPYSICLSGSHPSSAFFTKGFTIIRSINFHIKCE